MDDPSNNIDPFATRELSFLPLADSSDHSLPLEGRAGEGESDQAETITSPHSRTATRSGSGRLEVRCPNCHSPTEVATDSALTELICSSCGSQFSLVDNNAASRQAPPLAHMGRFELIARVGMGAFGSVWKARDKQLDRTVAIKIPRQSAMTATEQEQFFREARTAAQLRHPNIVSVHEVGRDGDSLYIVSDFVHGVTLNDWLTGQQLTSREAAGLCAKIASALHHAHEQGVIHRDLKPANIMIDAAGEPHLMDFGLARREVGELTVTTDGQVLGTPAYMSPEQAAGESHTADRRSDVYSLGVVLFQLLTGELPFRGNAGMVLHQVINDEPPSPRKFNANVAKDMETICLKCLNKAPGRRYETAAALARDLDRFINHVPIKAQRAGSFERAWRWCKRNPWPTGAIVTFVVLLIVSLCSSVKLKERLWTSLVAQARAARVMGERSQSLKLLAEARSIKASSMLEGETILTSAVAGASLRHEFDFASGGTSAPVRFLFDPKGQFFGVSGQVKVEQVTFDGNWYSGWSRHSETVDLPKARIWRLSDGEKMFESDRLTNIVFGPRGDVVALELCEDESDSAESAHTLESDWMELRDTRNWNLLTRLRGSTFSKLSHEIVTSNYDSVSTVCFNPKGEYLAFSDGTNVHFLNVSSRQAEKTSITGIPLEFVSTNEILTCGVGGKLARWDLSTRSRLNEERTLDEYLDAKSWDAPKSWDETMKKHVLFNSESAGFASVGATKLSSNGHMFAASGLEGNQHNVVIWDVPRNKQVARIRDIRGFVWGADDHWFATINDAVCQVWEVHPWAPELKLPEKVNSLGLNSMGNHFFANDDTFDVIGKGGKIRLTPHNSDLTDSDEEKRNSTSPIEEVSMFDESGQLWIARVGTAERKKPAQLWRVNCDQDEKEQILLEHPNYGHGSYTVLENGKDSRVVEKKARSIEGLTISPDASSIAMVCQLWTGSLSSGEKCIELWDLKSRQLKAIWNRGVQDSACSVVFSNDGKLLATGSERDVVSIWDVATQKEVVRAESSAARSRSGHRSHNCIRFTPDDRYVIYGGTWGALSILNVENGRRASWERHQGGILAIAVSPDSQLVASAGADGIIRLAKLPQGEEIAWWRAHESPVISLAFSPDGANVISGSEDGSVKFWERIKTDGNDL